MAAAVVPTSSSVPDMARPDLHISNFGFFGLRMPSQNNNANSNIGWFSVEGIVNGVRISEHTVFDSLRAINCYSGIVPYCGTSGVMSHMMTGTRACVENCSNMVAALGSPDGSPKLSILMVDFEAVYNLVVADSGNNLIGYLGYNNFGYNGTIASGAANLRVINLAQAAGHWTGAPAVPASTVAQQNTSYRDAAVSIQGGTVTVVAVDGTTVATVTNTTVIVPSGKNITLTYSAAPTWAWTLL
jgi:hypothetical protein